MKKIIRTGILLSLLLISSILAADEVATYTIHGVKDKRLEATYIASYRSVNCITKDSQTGGRHFGLFGKTIDVPDGNYTIKFPILVKKRKDEECDSEFAGLELVMRRKYDEKLASIHPILSSKKKVMPTYYKTDGGSAYHGAPDTPPYLETTKQYFRIAPQSTFLCKTFWFPKKYSRLLEKVREGHSQFHCTMQIDDDVNRSGYFQRDPRIYTFTHPEFGVDKIVDTDMKIDILVDEKNCKAIKNKKIVDDNFRELKKPSIWQKLF
ncbi:hypothetical protein [Sulfurimonas paralvinellae]|nr:hypothetical protein [Sulfurimonas paralvinellae]